MARIDFVTMQQFRGEVELRKEYQMRCKFLEKEIRTLRRKLEAFESPPESAGYGAINTETQMSINVTEHEKELLEVISEVMAERGRQDGKWGGPEHDDKHSTSEFIQWIEDYAGWARMMASMHDAEKTRRRLIQVAALAVAAVESIDRRKPIAP